MSKKYTIHKRRLKNILNIKSKSDLELISLASYYLKNGTTPVRSIKKIISPFSLNDWHCMDEDSRKVILDSYKLTIKN